MHVGVYIYIYIYTPTYIKHLLGINYFNYKPVINFLMSNLLTYFEFVDSQDSSANKEHIHTYRKILNCSIISINKYQEYWKRTAYLEKLLHCNLQTNIRPRYILLHLLTVIISRVQNLSSIASSESSVCRLIKWLVPFSPFLSLKLHTRPLLQRHHCKSFLLLVLDQVLNTWKHIIASDTNISTLPNKRIDFLTFRITLGQMMEL
jgi:hypothetical protein